MIAARLTSADRPWECLHGQRAGALLLAGWCALVSACSSDEAASPGPSWDEVEAEHAGGLLLSVWGAAPDDVWLVGGRPGATLVLRERGDGLQALDNPGAQTAWWVCSLGERVAIVGEAGLILRETAPGELTLLGSDIESTLYGCWGDSLDDFWVVGGDPLTGPAELAHIVDGVAAAPDLGDLLTELPKVLFKITGVGDQLVVVGADGVVLWRSPEGEWSLERIEGEPPLFTAASNSEDNLWVVGGQAAAVAQQYDGTRWRDRSPPALPNLFGVSVTRKEVLVAGASGTLVEGRSGSWQQIETRSEDTFHAVWLDGDGGAWAVGGNVLESEPARWHGMIWRRR